MNSKTEAPLMSLDEAWCCRRQCGPSITCPGQSASTTSGIPLPPKAKTEIKWMFHGNIGFDLWIGKDL